MTFESWYKELISDDIWHAQICFMYHKKNLKKTAHECYTWLLTQKNRWELQDFADFRRAYQSFLKNAKDDHVPIQTHQPKEEPKVEEPTVPRGSEKYMEWTNKIIAEIAKSKTINYFPGKSYAERAEEGGVRRPKDKPYPMTSEAEWYVKQRHLEWIKYAFEPRTGQRLPGTMDEGEWNIQYDNVIR